MKLSNQIIWQSTWLFAKESLSVISDRAPFLWDSPLSMTSVPECPGASKAGIHLRVRPSDLVCWDRICSEFSSTTRRFWTICCCFKMKAGNVAVNFRLLSPNAVCLSMVLMATASMATISDNLYRRRTSYDMRLLSHRIHFLIIFVDSDDPTVSHWKGSDSQVPIPRFDVVFGSSQCGVYDLLWGARKGESGSHT